jgi:hypothetical protein
MSLFNKIFRGKDKNVPEQPEDLFQIEITEEYAKVSHPKRPEEEINWNEIEEINIMTTDQGPFVPDVWLILMGNGKRCSIPQGYSGWEDVYNKVSKFPGFDFENVIKSATSIENKTFNLWKK